MGKGHVLFFYNKLAYLKRRQAELIKECQSRGFNVQFTVVDFVAPAELDGDWLPDDTALEINRKRINERLRG
jgi:deoxyribonuclease (pyrimidine dimer)